MWHFLLTYLLLSSLARGSAVETALLPLKAAVQRGQREGEGVELGHLHGEPRLPRRARTSTPRRRAAVELRQRLDGRGGPAGRGKALGRPACGAAAMRDAG